MKQDICMKTHTYTYALSYASPHTHSLFHPHSLTLVLGGILFYHNDNCDNRIPITQYHTNSIYSRSAIISVIALHATDQSAADYTLLHSNECKKCNQLLIGRNVGMVIMDDYKRKQNSERC